jgi:HSP20 family protein
VLRTTVGWLVKLDLAGVRREDLELSVQGNRLIVRGVRRDMGFEEGSLSHLMEIPYSRFERVIEVPFAMAQDPDVRLVDGMLLIRILAEVPRS